jgi:hypothetical protein
MGLFQEYLNSKGAVDKPKVSVTGDFVDPMTSPNAPKGGKPYGVSDGKKLKMSKDKGFGDEGDSKLKYEPKVDNKQSVAPAKIPTAEQAELCGVLVDAIKKDPSLTEQLVGQLRRNGLLGMVVAEMLQFKETYTHMAEVMSHDQYGPVVCSKLVRAMNEEVAPPFSSSLEGEEEQDEEPSENDFVGSEEGIDDGDMDLDMDMGDASNGNTDPNAADPLMGGQAAPQAPPQMPPPGASAMKNFQLALMGKK